MKARLLEFKISIFSILCWICCACSTNPITTPARPQEAPPTIKSVVEEILATPEEKIDIGKYALMLDKCIKPDIDIKREMSRLDNLANAIRPRLEGIKDPEKIIEILNRCLFEVMGFKPLEISIGNEFESISLYSVLAQRKGVCRGLSYLYLALAERLNLPIWGVALPRHFFVRYDDGMVKINIETVSGGENITDDGYINGTITLSSKPEDREIRKRLLKSLNKKEALGDYISAIAHLITKSAKEQGKEPDVTKHKLTQVLEYIDNAIKMAPDDFCNYREKGLILMFLDQIERGPDPKRAMSHQAFEEFLKAYQLYPYDLVTIAGVLGYSAQVAMTDDSNAKIELKRLFKEIGRILDEVTLDGFEEFYEPDTDGATPTEVYKMYNLVKDVLK